MSEKITLKVTHFSDLNKINSSISRVSSSSSLPYDEGVLIHPDYEIRTGEIPYSDQLKTEFQAYDLGGSGDCFFKSLNFCLWLKNLSGYKIPIYTSLSWYHFLGLDNFTHIEDTHITAVSNRLRITIVILVKRVNIYRFQRYGDYNLIVHLCEMDLNHYVSMLEISHAQLKLILNLELSTSDNFDYTETFSLTSGEFVEPEIIVDAQPTIAEVVQTADSGSDSDSFEEFDPHSSIPESPFPEERDPRYREEVSIDYFVSYCATLAKLVKDSKRLNNIDSKLYYKLRHNMFKTYCLSALGIISTKEIPFSHYKQLNVDSSRTPDYIGIFSDVALLIEFTVSNRRENAVKNKHYFSKYDDEIRRAAIPVKDFYLYLALDSDVEDVISQMHDISSLFALPLSPNYREELDDLLETMKTVTAYFNDFAPELLMLNEDRIDLVIPVKSLQEVEMFQEVKKLRGRKAVKQVRVRSLISRNLRKLQLSLRRKPAFGRYRICVNFVTSNCYIEEVGEGIEKDQLMNCLDQGSYPQESIKISGDYYLEKSIFQNVPIIEDPFDREQDYEIVVDTETYENRFFKTLMTQRMHTVAACPLEGVISEAQKLYVNKLESLHQSTRIVHYKSSPFIFYPSDLLIKGDYSVEISSPDFITKLLIKQAVGKNTVESKIVDRKIDYDKFEQLNRKIALLGRSLKSKYKSDFKKYTSMRTKNFEKELVLNPELSDIKNFREVKQGYRDLIMENTRIFYKNRIRINCKRDSRWLNETEHFNKPKNVYHIIKDPNLDALESDYKCMMDELFDEQVDACPDDVFLHTDPLGKTLADNCNDMFKDISTHEEDFKRTLLGHSALLISQVCYSLLYYSNIKLNKDDFVYDNLGYKNVLLMVKGGKKIRSTRTSRFFRLLMPITKLQSNVVSSQTNTLHVHNGQNYLLTPWRMLRISYLKKGLELYNNLGGYYASAMLEYNLSRRETLEFMSVKVLLMFSQKRKLEVWSSILRYIYLNSLGTHTDLVTLIPDMVMHDSDSLIYLLQRKFILSLPKIFENSRENRLYDIFWGNSIENFDLAAERFEENLFMAKAPFNPVSEHLKNLKSVIDTHDYFMKEFDTVDPDQILSKTNVEIGDDYFTNLESNDFKFDAKMSYIIGDFTGKYISSTFSKSDMNEEFNKIVTKTYTGIATGKGMRDTHGPEFFGKKGHDVVFSNFDPEFLINMLKDFPKTPSAFNKIISETEVDFVKRISSLSEHRLVFDMKDKEQYKGSREIYVMSEDTKLMQNPLEKFFGYLCRALPNEIIHKPSSSRPKFIHSKMFEHDYENKTVMYCTMDCRKWAPRSNLWKYYCFVKGMAKYLPDSFINYFMSFWPLMFKKTIRVQNSFLDLLSTNEGYKDKIKYFTRINENESELLMPYSFMMGIFNYLSSLMHAGSQLYFSERIAERLNSTCNFLAHSDDSGGLIISNNYDNCLKVYECYEKFQRSLNHLMSRKKCCLSKRSFEMISIMYNNQRYIPMVHKFMTNISFDPNGSGWYSDICTVVGKVVDLYNNGGSHIQCYILMLALGELYRKAYHLPRNRALSKIPLAFGGLFNCHPIHLILIGSGCQEGLLDLIETPYERSNRIAFFLSFAGEYNIGTGSRLTYRIPYIRRHDDALDLEDEMKTRLEALSTMPVQNTLLDYAKHLNRLFDPKYVYSLTGVDTNQIMLATLFYPTSVKYLSDKEILLKDLVSAYLTTHYIQSNGEFHNYAYPKAGHKNYFNQVENLKYSYTKVSIDSTKSCKPIRYSTIENFGLKISQESMMFLAAIEKWPSIKSVLSHPERFESMKDFCLRVLPGDIEDKLNYLKNFDPSEKEDKVRSGYLFIPSQIKIDNVSRFFAYSLLYTTRRYKISSQKPQMFTPSDLNSFDLNFEEKKHFCLSLKLYNRAKNDNAKDKLKNSIVNCPKCSNKDQMIKDFEEYLSMMDKDEFQEFTPNLPFVDYATTQFRGKNVWFSNCDFNIVTRFGSVESRQIEGSVHTTWKVINSENLGELWQYYIQFCKSRGIQVESIIYQDTGFKHPRLAFNDFETPYVPPLYSRGMILPNSRIELGRIPSYKLHRRGRNFYINDRSVDFSIYAIYDINQIFYDSHDLKSIRKYLYDVDFVIDKDILLSNFSSSKTYSLLLNDERHFSIQQDKYVRNGFLGQPGSFTRALVLSDEKGDTKYRSSYRPQFVSKGAIEFDTVEGVPVLDMFEKASFSRLTSFERRSFGKALDGFELTYSDKQNLLNIKRKMGLESLGTAVTLYKHIMRGMLANSAHNLPPRMILDMFKLMFDSIHACMAEYPKENYLGQYEGRSRSFWCFIKSIVQNDLDHYYTPTLIAKGLLRAKSDNQDKFWAYIRDDPLLSCLSINSYYYANLVLMIKGMLSNKIVKRDFKTILYQNDTPKYRHLALSQDLYKEISGDSDLVNDILFRQGEPKIYDEDCIDQITGGDEIEDDQMEELEDREFEGDSYRAVILSGEDTKIVMQETAQNDFSRITLLSPCQYICFPWLGKGNFRMSNVRGVEYYISEFPGDNDYPDLLEKKIRKVSERSFNELLDKMEESKKESEKEEAKLYVPSAFRDRSSAKKVLEQMGVYNTEIFGYVYGKETLGRDWIEDALKEFQLVGGFENQKVNIDKRRHLKFHLPGFQGLLDDPMVKSEIVSIFGENANYLISGNVRLNKNSYNHTMRSLKKLFPLVAHEDKAIILFFISTLLDTIESNTSDGWYLDGLNSVIDAIEDRLTPLDDSAILPVASRGIDRSNYREKDIFD